LANVSTLTPALPQISHRVVLLSAFFLRSKSDRIIMASSATVLESLVLKELVFFDEPFLRLISASRWLRFPFSVPRYRRWALR